MLVFAPVFLLLAGALAILGVQRVKPSVGYSWLAAVIATTLAAGLMVYLRWQLPQQVAIESWLPYSTFTDSPIFALDGSSWPYSFCLSAVALAVVLTASARLQSQVNPYAWAGMMSLVAVGILAVLSANLLTLMLTWTTIDVIELLILQANSSDRTLNNQTVIAFAVRVTGTVMVMVAALFSKAAGVPPTFASLPSVSSLLLLLASGLRLGVLPLHLTSIQAIITRRGLGTGLRMVEAASSLTVLVRLPPNSVPPELAGPLLALTALAGLYSAVVWLSSPDEIAGRPYWLIAIASLAVASVIQGQPRASLAWGVLLILPGSLVFLFSARRRSILYLPVLALLGMSGLPFTPAVSGWTGVLSGGINFWGILFILVHALLMLGLLRFCLAPGEDLAHMERWVQAVYPAGMVVLVLGQWLTGALGWPGSFGGGVWWAGLASVVLLVLGILLPLAGRRTGIRNDSLDRWTQATLQRAGDILTAVFSLNWLYRLLWSLYSLLQEAIQVMTDILEGDGGVLWVFVLLALFVSVVRSRMSP